MKKADKKECKCACHEKDIVNDCHYLNDNKCYRCGGVEDKKCNSKHCGFDENEPSDKVMVLKLSDRTAKLMAIEADKGNIPSKLDLILHNQGILNGKLNRLLDKRRK